MRAFRHPLFGPALGLSLRSSGLSLLWILIAGTPIAWVLARTEGAWAKWLDALIGVPIVLPPAVIGLALLLALGRRSALGGLLASWGIEIPFSLVAVVLAQVVVAAPFYIQAAVAAFRRVDPQLIDVARSLGATRRQAMVRVALPMALPGLAAGGALAWARALGEFGATMLLAGNLPGQTQTMPLAIFSAFESDLRAAVALALALTLLTLPLLFVFRHLVSGAGQSGARR